jgi:uncharacterized membrane protein
VRPLVVLVIVLHAAAIAFMLTGGLLAVRRPRILWFHIPISLAIFALFASGTACPITNLELWLRARAGMPGYGDGGYIGHYTLRPFGIDVATTGAQILLYTLAFTPNVVAYTLHVGRLVRRLTVRTPARQ